MITGWDNPQWHSDHGIGVGNSFLARWGVSSKWLKVDVYFSLGLGGEFSISHLQVGEHLPSKHETLNSNPQN
jgi:hypothetical protein